MLKVATVTKGSWQQKLWAFLFKLIKDSKKKACFCLHSVNTSEILNILKLLTE